MLRPEKKKQLMISLKSRKWPIARAVSGCSSKHAAMLQCKGRWHHKGGSYWLQWTIFTPQKMWARVPGGEGGLETWEGVFSELLGLKVAASGGKEGFCLVQHGVFHTKRGLFFSAKLFLKCGVFVLVQNGFFLFKKGVF